MTAIRPEITGRPTGSVTSAAENLPDNLLEWPVELLRIADPPEVERLSSLDWDTFERNHKDKVVYLSKRRKGARVGHALMLPSNRG
jgi:hypothetical protein